MPKDKINKTNACRILDQKKVVYELVPYEVDEEDLGAQHIAEQLGEDIDQVFKTLVLKGDKIGYFVCVIPGNDELDLKKLASYGVLAAEMEAAALYLAAAKQNVEALAIFTVSNHLLTHESTPARDRERTFDDMARIALETIIQD